MKGKNLTAVLIYLALYGATGLDQTTELTDDGATGLDQTTELTDDGATGHDQTTELTDDWATHPKGNGLINVTNNDVEWLLKCICHTDFTARCAFPVTTSIDDTTASLFSDTDLPTVKHSSNCQINLHGRVNCTRSNMSNDMVCTIQCNSSSVNKDSVILTLDNDQSIQFSLQNTAAESQIICDSLFTSTFTSTFPTLDGGTTTNIFNSSETFNHTVYHESEALSSGSIAGIAIGVTLGVSALVCIIVGYLLCRRRFKRITGKIPRPPAKSYLHNESFKKIDYSCENVNIGSLSAKDVEENASTNGVYYNQVIGPDYISSVVATTDGGDGLEYEDVSGLKSMRDSPSYLQRMSLSDKNKHSPSEMNSTYSNVPENYVVLDSCFTYDLGQDYVKLSLDNSVKLPIPADLKSNRTIQSKPKLGIHVTTADPKAISTLNVFDESMSANADNKQESVYFELEKVSDDDDDIAESENDTEIYSNI